MFEVGSFTDLNTFTQTALTETALCRQCPLSHYRAAPCTNHSDVVCLPISPTCEANAGEFEAAPPTPTTDRVCQQLVCLPGVTHYRPGNGSSCSICTTCAAVVEYQTAPCGLTTDRSCAPVSTCAADRNELIAPTPTSDRVCEQDCAPNQFVQIITSGQGAPTQACVNLTVCVNDTFQFLAPTRLSDRTCVARTQCSARQFESVAGTPTTDRTCSRCNDCGGGVADVIFALDTSTSVCSAGT